MPDNSAQQIHDGLEEEEASLLLIPAKPQVEVFFNQRGGVTIRVEEFGESSLVAIPEEYLLQVSDALRRAASA